MQKVQFLLRKMQQEGGAQTDVSSKFTVKRGVGRKFAVGVANIIIIIKEYARGAQTDVSRRFTIKRGVGRKFTVYFEAL